MAGMVSIRLANKYAKGQIQIDQVDQSKFEVLQEDFFDEVFGNESIIERKIWIDNVCKKKAFIFDPAKIREAMNIIDES